MENTNVISYRYYEKPTTTNTMVQKRSALEENSKAQILSNDLVRRLGNTDTRQVKNTLGEVVDQFGRKLMTSGYSLKQARKITLGGIRGWERKLERAKTEGRRIFKTSGDSLSGRIKKKTLGKTNWFKKRKNKSPKTPGDRNNEEGKTGGPHGGTGKNMNRRNVENTKEDVRTSTVLFVENTKNGALAKSMREVMERLKYILGYNIKIVERAGTPLKLMFPLSRIGEGGECGRGDCTTCTQESRGEKLPPCRKRNVLY